nr:uncharacterized protein LOC125422012 [Ziziphus jujuba var. spinosa]
MELEEKSHNHHSDLISELPQSMIFKIMSLLSMEDAIRFSFASKKLFSAACKSIPVLDFDFFSFKKNSKRFSSASSFHNFVAKSLQMFCNSTDDDTACFQRMSFVGPISNILVYKMVDFSLNNKIKELNLNGDFDKTSRVACSLPNTLFSAKHLTSLTIKGFYLEGLEDQNLVLGCQLIEDISLSCCSGFKTISLSGERLKHVVLDSCPQLMKINIDPRVSLESLSCSSALFEKQLKKQEQSNYCEIFFAFNSFKLLKFLEFKNTDIVTDEWFRDHVSRLSLLETLKLDNCSKLKNVRISSHNLKTLEFRECEQLEIIYIKEAQLEIIYIKEAPNLESFLFDIMGKENHCKVINISSSSKYVKSLIVGGASVSDEWIDDIFSRFLYLEHLELKSCNLLKNIEFCAGKLTSLKLLTCTNLSKIEITAPNLVSFTYNGNLLPSHPVLISSSRLHATVSLSNTIFYTMDFSQDFRNFIGSFDHCQRLILVNIFAGFHDKPGVQEDNMSCCASYPIKCWRHFLVGVEMDNFEDSCERSNVQNFLIKNTMGLINVICNTH